MGIKLVQGRVEFKVGLWWLIKERSSSRGLVRLNQMWSSSNCRLGIFEIISCPRKREGPTTDEPI